jgi:hypothetical protein
MLALVGLIAISCVLLARVKESPMMAPKRETPIEPASKPAG